MFTVKSDKPHWKKWLIVIAVLIVFLALALLIIFRRYFSDAAQPDAPDLTMCTRVEINYIPSIKQRFFGNTPMLNTQEEQYISSLESIDIVNSDDIKTLAQIVVSAEYLGGDFKPIKAAEYVQVTGYFDSKPKVSFIVWSDEMRIKKGRVFHIFMNEKFPRYFDKIRNNNVPFIRRLYCERHLKELRKALRKATGVENKYPIAAEWSDVMEQYRQARYPTKERITWSLKCPAQQEGKCHYAMNPNCKPDSPSDMVLLFETKAGWNQHGGPELFTFDNHDPKGGCVLLNDGTVKFIRTKDELQQLRWK